MYQHEQRRTEYKFLETAFYHVKRRTTGEYNFYIAVTVFMNDGFDTFQNYSQLTELKDTYKRIY